MDAIMDHVDATASSETGEIDMDLIYAFWNNKGGTGKTSLAFQAIARYAELHPEKRVLAIDLCPRQTFQS